jgi:hypothetical protein
LIKFTHQSIETILAIYAGVVSTYSIYLGARAHKLAEKAYLAAGPLVSVRWEYDESVPDLVVSVVNSGRSDVTIYDLTMGVVQETVTRMSPTGRSFDVRMTNVELIETMRWWRNYDPSQLPVRLAASSRFSVHVKRDSISHLPGSLPLYDILLRFVAETADDYISGYFRGDILRHFIGLEPEVPVREREPTFRDRYRSSRSGKSVATRLLAFINRAKPSAGSD